jgi:hypothetical protein
VPASYTANPTQVRAGRTSFGAYQCGPDTFLLSWQVLPPRVGARTVFSASISNTTPPGWELVETRMLNVGTGKAAQSWSQSEFAAQDRREILASAVWVGGGPAWGMEGRIRQALNVFRRCAVPTIVARVDHVSSNPPAAFRNAMDRFLHKTESLSSLIGRASELDCE